MKNHDYYMKQALKEAEKARKIDEVPIGAVIVKEDQIIARAHNLREKKQKATAHAEILAIEKACKKLGTWRLEDCSLYVTLEPCPMCAGACIQSRIKTIIYGASDPKGGSVKTCVDLTRIKEYNHHPQVLGGIMEEGCSQILKDYFKTKRKQK